MTQWSLARGRVTELLVAAKRTNLAIDFPVALERKRVFLCVKAVLSFSASFQQLWVTAVGSRRSERCRCKAGIMTQLDMIGSQLGAFVCRCQCHTLRLCPLLPPPAEDSDVNGNLFLFYSSSASVTADLVHSCRQAVHTGCIMHVQPWLPSDVKVSRLFKSAAWASLYMCEHTQALLLDHSDVSLS